MCIYHSVALRNAVVEENLWCIDAVIRANHVLMKAAHLDYDDVYQWLALRMIHAVATFNPSKGVLRQHIFAQLHYELLNCKGSQRQYGFADAPWDLRGAVVSLECLAECNPDWELHIAA